MHLRRVLLSLCMSVLLITGLFTVVAQRADAESPQPSPASVVGVHARMGLLASSRLASRHVSVPLGRYGSHVAWGTYANGGLIHSTAVAASSCPWPPASDSPPSSLISPPDGATIATTTPELSAVSILTAGTPLYEDCYPTAYDFKVMTAAGGGQTVADSGWLYNPFVLADITNWAVPEGALRDGETYYVAVQTDDSELLLSPLPATTITEFTVNLRKGAGGPSPTDTVGSTPSGTTTPAQGSPTPGLSPASETVNLLTGDLALTAGTHSLQTVSGSAGVSLSYNSLDADLYGLDARYYVDTGDHSFSAADTLIGQKVDPMIDFNWDQPSIGSLPLSGATGFLVRWTGTIYVPVGSPTTQAGNWQFGVQAGGGMLVCIDQTSSVWSIERRCGLVDRRCVVVEPCIWPDSEQPGGGSPRNHCGDLGSGGTQRPDRVVGPERHTVRSQSVDVRCAVELALKHPGVIACRLVVVGRIVQRGVDRSGR